MIYNMIDKFYIIDIFSIIDKHYAIEKIKSLICKKFRP